MNKEKLSRTMRIYDEYEKRFARARAARPYGKPWLPEYREKTVEETKRMLAFREELVPTVGNVEEVSKSLYEKFDVTQLRYTTWENFIGCASLFMPHTDKKVPLVFLLCGHGKFGRLSPAYVAMAQRLAEIGIAVMMPENIGQGDRAPLGHREAIVPFFAGLTLQGLIVMETVALIRHMKNDGRFDTERFGACGNSGGGTLSLFLSALAPELSAISASGYPSEFSYLLAKEKNHCACNLLPGCAHSPEMYEILSTFAPKPMLLEGGLDDCLIPADLAARNARKVRFTYQMMNAEKNFSFVAPKTSHPWAYEDRQAIAEFFSRVFGADKLSEKESEELDASDFHVSIAADAMTVNELAQRLGGITAPSDLTLADIFPPMSRGVRIRRGSVIAELNGVDVMRNFAQMECALKKFLKR